jgi:hypothetical protein
MEENPYDVFLRNIYCQFVTEGVPSGGGNKKEGIIRNNMTQTKTMSLASPYYLFHRII